MAGVDKGAEVAVARICSEPELCRRLGAAAPGNIGSRRHNQEPMPCRTASVDMVALKSDEIINRSGRSRIAGRLRSRTGRIDGTTPASLALLALHALGPRRLCKRYESRECAVRYAQVVVRAGLHPSARLALANLEGS